VIGLPAGVCIWLAAGVKDMRAALTSLAAKERTKLERDPFCDHVFVVRGTCLLMMRLEKGRIVWPQATVTHH